MSRTYDIKLKLAKQFAAKRIAPRRRQLKQLYDMGIDYLDQSRKLSVKHVRLY